MTFSYFGTTNSVKYMSILWILLGIDFYNYACFIYFICHKHLVFMEMTYFASLEENILV